MATKFFVTRSAVRTANSDHDGQMAREQIGPFTSAEEARNAWAERMARALLGTYSDRVQSWKVDFRGQYLALLTAADRAPEWDKVEADGIRWTIRSV